MTKYEYNKQMIHKLSKMRGELGVKLDKANTHGKFIISGRMLALGDLIFELYDEMYQYFNEKG